MNSLVLLILGMILLNSIVQLIPMFFPDLDPGLYIPYQLWINVLLVFNWLLPSRKGLYLFKKIDENIVDAIPVDAIPVDAPSVPPVDDFTPSAPPVDDFTPSVPPVDDFTPSAPPVDDFTPSDNNVSGLTTELNPDGSFPSNYDIYASRAD